MRLRDWAFVGLHQGGMNKYKKTYFYSSNLKASQR
jgi:hypothetical protein